jgi:hypothetical protein
MAMDGSSPMFGTRAGWETDGDAQPRPHGNTYWLWPGRVLAGEHPGNGGTAMLDLRLRGLQAAGITCCIDLTGALDPVSAYQPLAVGGRPARRLPFGIADFGVPSAGDMRRVLDAIDEALRAGDGVFLHCRAGIGRTGVVAGCLLVEQGFTPAEALALVQRKYRAMTKSALAPHSPETAEQRAFIERWVPGAGRG